MHHQEMCYDGGGENGIDNVSISHYSQITKYFNISG
jgi:hypothetical protein